MQFYLLRLYVWWKKKYTENNNHKVFKWNLLERNWKLLWHLIFFYIEYEDFSNCLSARIMNFSNCLECFHVLLFVLQYVCNFVREITHFVSSEFLFAFDAFIRFGVLAYTIGTIFCMFVDILRRLFSSFEYQTKQEDYSVQIVGGGLRSSNTRT